MKRRAQWTSNPIGNIKNPRITNTAVKRAGPYLLGKTGIVAVVVIYPLLSAYWGESVSVALWGFAASFSHQSSSRAATPEGSLH